MVSRIRNFGLNVECNIRSSDSLFSPLDFAESAVLKSPPQTPFLQIYNELYREFHSLGVSHLRQQSLKKIALECHLSPSWSYKKIYSMLNSIADLLLLNQVEILYWGMLLENASMEDRSVKPRLLTIYTAYLAKMSMNDDMEPFEQHLNRLFANFKLSFNNWLLITDCSAAANIKDMNSKYNNLIYTVQKKTNVKNYDEMVDALLEMPGKRQGSISETESDILSVEEIEEELEAFREDMTDDKSPLFSVL
ncbi:unnamed protein product [Blepharisma stoltei]|uniref:Uncharacterized protein n=1 Tax=Blepharisma stoltei TaxID=1481888 RepID=A0AAU9K5K4_9CILI|nr:unnamed protein product [Blepharisma stoltei]